MARSGKQVPLKQGEELDRMRAACRIATRVLRAASALVRPGIATADLDQEVGRLIREQGAVSAFLGYRGFPSNCCLSVNEAVIHGIGNARRLQFGDLLKLDVGVRFQGFVGDIAMTVPVGGCSASFQKLMDTTAEALYKGISAARADSSVFEIGKAVHQCAAGSGYGVVREFCGHGVGRNVHEDPQIPNYPDPTNRTKLRAGMTVAIEPMVTLGDAAVEILSDGWTVVTRDRQVAAHFEHTVLITDSEPEILTRDEGLPLY
jgi:methionyl aminopeptidase